MKNKKFVITVVVALLVGFIALVVHNYNTKTSFKYAKETQKQAETTAQDAVSATVNQEAANPVVKRDEQLLKVRESELFLGDKKAPVVMIEYASLSCPHCAIFYREAFEKLKSEYIDSGKVKFVFRDFPLNQQALVAAMVADCRLQDEKEERAEKYYGLVKALFKTQDSWAFDPKYTEKLESIAKLDGMSSERFKSCIEDQKLQTKVLQLRMEAAKSLQIHSTPTFFVNGEVSEGYVDYLTLKKLIDKKLSEIK
jgi:protein-disulfide isomerase